MMNIAVIPARGGSKRIPRKNIKFFHGLPVIAYAIRAAKASGVIDEVFVSTDDDEIAKISESFGATIPWMRPKNLSGDYVTTVSVMKDTVIKLKLDSPKIENVCCIYPATPLLGPNYLTQGLEVLERGDWSYVISALRANTPPYRFFSLGATSQVELLFPEHEEHRTQDLPVAFQDAGQFYWGKESSWALGLPIFSSRSTIIEIPFKSALDIDTLDDWVYAERLYSSNRTDLK